MAAEAEAAAFAQETGVAGEGKAGRRLGTAAVAAAGAAALRTIGTGAVSGQGGSGVAALRNDGLPNAGSVGEAALYGRAVDGEQLRCCSGGEPVAQAAGGGVGVEIMAGREAIGSIHVLW